MKLKNMIKRSIIKLKEDIPAVFLSMHDKETPFIAKFFGYITIIYALSPIDLIPDFIPVFGYLDDIIILPFLVFITLRFIPKKVIERNRQKAKDLWTNGKPKKWYYAVPMIAFWLMIVILIIVNL